jgi:hypothetical protein
MKDLNISLREIAKNYNYYDHEFDKTGIDSFGTYNPTKFAQKIQLFSNTRLHTISAGECDFVFNSLLRDTNLYNTNPIAWEGMAKYVVDTIGFLTTDLSKDSGYRREYASFMNERESYRNYNAGTKKYLSQYNSHVVKWRFT